MSLLLCTQMECDTTVLLAGFRIELQPNLSAFAGSGTFLGKRTRQTAQDNSAKSWLQPLKGHLRALQHASIVVGEPVVEHLVLCGPDADGSGAGRRAVAPKSSASAARAGLALAVESLQRCTCLLFVQQSLVHLALCMPPLRLQHWLCNAFEYSSHVNVEHVLPQDLREVISSCSALVDWQLRYLGCLALARLLSIDTTPFAFLAPANAEVRQGLQQLKKAGFLGSTPSYAEVSESEGAGIGGCTLIILDPRSLTSSFVNSCRDAASLMLSCGYGSSLSRTLQFMTLGLAGLARFMRPDEPRVPVCIYASAVNFLQMRGARWWLDDIRRCIKEGHADRSSRPARYALALVLHKPNQSSKSTRYGPTGTQVQATPVTQQNQHQQETAYKWRNATVPAEHMSKRHAPDHVEYGLDGRTVTATKRPRRSDSHRDDDADAAPAAGAGTVAAGAAGGAAASADGVPWNPEWRQFHYTLPYGDPRDPNSGRGIRPVSNALPPHHRNLEWVNARTNPVSTYCKGIFDVGLFFLSLAVSMMPNRGGRSSNNEDGGSSSISSTSGVFGAGMWRVQHLQEDRHHGGSSSSADDPAILLLDACRLFYFVVKLDCSEGGPGQGTRVMRHASWQLLLHTLLVAGAHQLALDIARQAKHDYSINVADDPQLRRFISQCESRAERGISAARRDAVTSSNEGHSSTDKDATPQRDDGAVKCEIKTMTIAAKVWPAPVTTIAMTSVGATQRMADYGIQRSALESAVADGVPIAEMEDDSEALDVDEFQDAVDEAVAVAVDGAVSPVADPAVIGAAAARPTPSVSAVAAASHKRKLRFRRGRARIYFACDDGYPGTVERLVAEAVVSHHNGVGAVSNRMWQLQYVLTSEGEVQYSLAAGVSSAAASSRDHSTAANRNNAQKALEPLVHLGQVNAHCLLDKSKAGSAGSVIVGEAAALLEELHMFRPGPADQALHASTAGTSASAASAAAPRARMHVQLSHRLQHAHDLETPGTLFVKDSGLAFATDGLGEAGTAAAAASGAAAAASSSSKGAVGSSAAVVPMQRASSSDSHLVKLRAIHSENLLWNTLFSILVIYSDLSDPDTLIPHPWLTCNPEQLFRPRNLVHARSRELLESLSKLSRCMLRQHLHDIITSLRGCMGTRLRWDAFIEEDLLSIIHAAGGPAISAIMKRLSRNTVEISSGLPDLCVWEEEECDCCCTDTDSDDASENAVAASSGDGAAAANAAAGDNTSLHRPGYCSSSCKCARLSAAAASVASSAAAAGSAASISGDNRHRPTSRSSRMILLEVKSHRDHVMTHQFEWMRYMSELVASVPDSVHLQGPSAAVAASSSSSGAAARSVGAQGAVGSSIINNRPPLPPGTASTSAHQKASREPRVPCGIVHVRPAAADEEA